MRELPVLLTMQYMAGSVSILFTQKIKLVRPCASLLIDDLLQTNVSAVDEFAQQLSCSV